MVGGRGEARLTYTRQTFGCEAVLVAHNLFAEFDLSHWQAVRVRVSLPARAVDALREPLLSIMRGEFGW